MLLKWRAMRYLPAGEKLWLRLHNLYHIAENEGFHRQTQRAYADDAAECSCETAYLHILMANLANSGTLYPKQIDLLDRWLCNWHESLRLELQQDNTIHSFVVDLSADFGPRRARKPDASKPMRFWNTSDLLIKLKELQTALQDRQPPCAAGADGKCPVQPKASSCLNICSIAGLRWPTASNAVRRAHRSNGWWMWLTD